MHRCFLFMLLCSITSNGETYDEKFERDNVLCLPSDQDQPSSCNKCVDANCDWIVLPDMLTRLCTTTWDDADGYFDDAEPTDVVQDMELDAETDPLSYLFRATQDPLQCDDEPFETISARRPAKTSSFPIEKDPNTNGGNSDPNPEGNGGTSSNSSSKSKFPKGLLFGGPIAITMLVAMVVGYRTWRVRRQTYNPSHSVPEPVELTEVAVTAAYRYGLDSITEENDNEPRASNSSSTATSERANSPKRTTTASLSVSTTMMVSIGTDDNDRLAIESTSSVSSRRPNFNVPPLQVATVESTPSTGRTTTSSGTSTTETEMTPDLEDKHIVPSVQRVSNGGSTRHFDQDQEPPCP